MKAWSTFFISPKTFSHYHKKTFHPPPKKPTQTPQNPTIKPISKPKEIKSNFFLHYIRSLHVVIIKRYSLHTLDLHLTRTAYYLCYQLSLTTHTYIHTIHTLNTSAILKHVTNLIPSSFHNTYH